MEIGPLGCNISQRTTVGDGSLLEEVNKGNTFGARVRGGPYLGFGVCHSKWVSGWQGTAHSALMVCLVLRSNVSCQKPSKQDRKCAVVPALEGPVLIVNSSEVVIYGVEGGYQDRAPAVIKGQGGGDFGRREEIRAYESPRYCG